MDFEETKEQQQMYNYFRSCIYFFLIIEIVMKLPITADNKITQFILDLFARFKVFNSLAGCKLCELVCICVDAIGTKAEKALKFNLKTMVIYPALAGVTLVGGQYTLLGEYPDALLLETPSASRFYKYRQSLYGNNRARYTRFG